MDCFAAKVADADISGGCIDEEIFYELRRKEALEVNGASTSDKTIKNLTKKRSYFLFGIRKYRQTESRCQ